MKYCARCGAPEQPGARFCPACGRKYDAADRSGFSLRNAIGWRPLEAAVERVVRWMEPVSDFVMRWLRRGFEELLSDNYAAPSFMAWNLLATLFCSLPCGFVGLVYSLRVLQLKRNNDDSPVSASRYAKLWLTLAVVWFFVVRAPLCLKWG